MRLQQEFQRQILRPSPPTSKIWKYPPGIECRRFGCVRMPPRLVENEIGKKNAIRQGIISNNGCMLNCMKLRINANDKSDGNPQDKAVADTYGSVYFDVFKYGNYMNLDLLTFCSAILFLTRFYLALFSLFNLVFHTLHILFYILWLLGLNSLLI